MTMTGISSRSRVGFAALAATALMAVSADMAIAQVNRQQQEIREGNRAIQQELSIQQREQQRQFQYNQLRDQQLRQQQFPPVSPPTIVAPPTRR